MSAAHDLDPWDELPAADDDWSDDDPTPPEQSWDEPTTEQLYACLAAKHPPLDWREVWDTSSDDVDWLVEPFLERGRAVALFSPAKTGKSLLALEVAAALAAGRPVLGNPAQPPQTVVYVDLENSPQDLRERLQALGYGPEDLERLVYLSFPSLPALDSRPGGQELTAVALHHQAALVVLDTVSRVIAGKENDSDTFLALYRHAIAPLKGAGIAVLRLDHSGKDLERGQRGSSAKSDDVDAVWVLTALSPTRLHLKCERRRQHRDIDHLTLLRRGEPLRHERVSGRPDVPADVADTMRQLDELDVPLEWGRDRVAARLREAGFRVGNDLLAATIRTRREIAQNLSRTGPDAGQPDPTLDDCPPATDSTNETAGPTCPGQAA
ncbi:MAG: AAA family ATPase, partial [Actinomycetes bacterium]